MSGHAGHCVFQPCDCGEAMREDARADAEWRREARESYALGVEAALRAMAHQKEKLTKFYKRDASILVVEAELERVIGRLREMLEEEGFRGRATNPESVAKDHEAKP